MTQSAQAETSKYFDDVLARGLDTFEKSEARLRELGEQMLESARQTGEASLNAYEKALASALELETRAAELTRVDFINSAARAHVGFVNEMSEVFTGTARSLLK